MIKAGNTYITADVEDIISKLKAVLETKGIERFYKNNDTPNNLMVCCPFHKEGQERNPSMGILKSDGTCHCFACGWVGSLSEMISNCFGYDDMGLYGDKWLIKNFLTLEVEERDDIELDMERNSRSNNSAYSNKKCISEEELDSYRYIHPYMYKRKLTDEIIELFDIGYDKKKQCLTFPVRDIDGNTLFIARRSVRTKYFNYPRGVEKPLYGLYELYKTNGEKNYKNSNLKGTWRHNTIIICESMIDALTCWVYGKPALALNGLGNELQFKQLRNLPCRSLILATDNDKAGIDARLRISENVPNKIIYQYMLPEGKKDINELSKEEFDNLFVNFL